MMPHTTRLWSCLSDEAGHSRNFAKDTPLRTAPRAVAIPFRLTRTEANAVHPHPRHPRLTVAVSAAWMYALQAAQAELEIPA